MRTEPLPSCQEVFFEVYHEESQKKVMMGGQYSSPTLKGSTLAARGSGFSKSARYSSTEEGKTVVQSLC